MLRDITLGQYYQADSVIHRLDPRTKLIMTFVYLISLFIFTDPYVYIAGLLFLVIALAMSRVPIKFMIKGLKPVWLIILITSLMNIMFSDGEPLFQLWKFKVTAEGLERAGFMAGRLVLLVFGSNLMTLTTTPTRLTNALEALMKPLKYIHFPVHEIAMMMSIALRFIPLLVDETDKIMKAQLARGADFESGNILKRTKAMVPVLVPLFISAFRRANDLTMAMEARCYHGGEGRTQMKPLKYKGRDFITFLVLVLYLALVVFLGHFLPGILG